MVSRDEILNTKKNVVRVALDSDVHHFLCTHLKGVPRKKWAAAIATLASVGLAVSKMANASDKTVSNLYDGRTEDSVSNLSAGDENQAHVMEPVKQERSSAPHGSRPGNVDEGASTAAQQVLPEATIRRHPGLHAVETSGVPGHIELDECTRDEMSALFGAG